MTWVKAVWVLKSLLETKINVDYIRLLKKKKKNQQFGQIKKMNSQQTYKS